MIEPAATASGATVESQLSPNQRRPGLPQPLPSLLSLPSLPSLAVLDAVKEVIACSAASFSAAATKADAAIRSAAALAALSVASSASLTASFASAAFSCRASSTAVAGSGEDQVPTPVIASVVVGRGAGLLSSTWCSTGGVSVCSSCPSGDAVVM